MPPSRTSSSIVPTATTSLRRLLSSSDSRRLARNEFRSVFLSSPFGLVVSTLIHAEWTLQEKKLKAVYIHTSGTGYVLRSPLPAILMHPG